MQVMVRRKQLTGDPLLTQADVISVDGEIMRVKFPGSLSTVEVQASDTLPVMNMSNVSGTRAIDPRRPQTAIQKSYPTAKGAIVNMFPR